MADTPIDAAFVAMQAEPENDAARLRFYERFSDAELFLLLKDTRPDKDPEPRVFPVADGSFVLVFDTEERLTAFSGGVSPNAILSGRTLVEMLYGKGIGVGLNLDVAPSEFLMSTDAVDWLARTLSNGPEELAERIATVQTPGRLPEDLLVALDQKVPAFAGVASSVFLAEVAYSSGRHGHIIAFLGTPEFAKPAVASAVSEALVFSGLEAGELDVVFPLPEEAITETLQRVGLRISLPEPDPTVSPVAPGMDPERPPRLK